MRLGVEIQSVLLFCRRRLRHSFFDHVNFDTIVCVMLVVDRA